MEQQCFSSLKNQKKLLLSFTKFCKHAIKIETQKIVNLLDSSENEYSKFTTKKWCLIDSETKGNYSQKNPVKVYNKFIRIKSLQILLL